MTRIQDRDVSIDSLVRQVTTSDAGAVVTFVGVVRNDDIERMELEAYREVAEAELEKIRQEAIGTFGLISAEVIHRIGSLAVGDTIVVIACSAAHRASAFEGCRYIIEELKKRAPIWKKEIRRNGGTWVQEDR
jgi:molybdopterin synthase catalytic subunit